MWESQRKNCRKKVPLNITPINKVHPLSEHSNQFFSFVDSRALMKPLMWMSITNVLTKIKG